MEIIYIAGAGHSGSTLIDIVLGNREGSFSLGELYYLPDKGIIGRQYCSCGEVVPECHFWKGVIADWESGRKLTLEAYISAQRAYHRTANLPITAFRLFLPDRRFSDYLQDTRLLFESIARHSGASILIDSSKNPNRILILRKLGFPLKIIHLSRRFSGVLHSNKKSSKKDLLAGIEADRFPLRTRAVLLQWMGYQFFTIINALGIRRIRIRYEDLISDLPATIARIQPVHPAYLRLLEDRGPFIPRHLAAGNKIRMLPSLAVAERPVVGQQVNLKLRDRILGRLVDLFY